MGLQNVHSAVTNMSYLVSLGLTLFDTIPIEFPPVFGYILAMGINDNDEERRKRLLSKIAKFRLFDDDFMSKIFEDDIEATEFLLRTILQRDDLVVTESKGQVSVKNLRGRSVRLDIKAKDKDGKLYNVEVQRADKGAGAKRARFYSAILDANALLPGKRKKDNDALPEMEEQDFDALPETYVIFITENDVLNGGKPLYHIERRIEELGLAFGDESHIIYVNGKYRGDDAIGRLMHDFSCTDPDDMNSSILAERARYLKKDEKGVRQMSVVMEELIAEDRREQAEKFAVSLLKDGTYSVTKIAQLFNLPEERVRELAEQAAEPVLA